MHKSAKKHVKYVKKSCYHGYRALTPIGNNAKQYWESLKKELVSRTNYMFDTEKFKTKFACELKDFQATEFLDRKDAENLTGLANMLWL